MRKKKHCEKTKKPLNTNFNYFFALKGIFVVSLLFLFFIIFLYFFKYQILSSANLIIIKEPRCENMKMPLDTSFNYYFLLSRVFWSFYYTFYYFIYFMIYQIAPQLT
jgi:hypothetical protein